MIVVAISGVRPVVGWKSVGKAASSPAVIASTTEVSVGLILILIRYDTHTYLGVTLYL